MPGVGEKDDASGHASDQTLQWRITKGLWSNNRMPVTNERNNGTDCLAVRARQVDMIRVISLSLHKFSSGGFADENAEARQKTSSKIWKR